MSDPILPLAVWEEGTLQNDVPANDNSLRIEALSREVLAVANSPSVSTDGTVYIVGSAPTGDFSTFDEDDLTIYYGGTWYAWAPVAGIIVNVAGVLKRWNGSAYVDAFAASFPAVVVDATTARTMDPNDAGTYLRFTNSAAKAATFDDADGFSAGQEFHITNRAVSGDLTLTEAGSMTLNPPKGGTLVLNPGDTVTVKMVDTDEADVMGSTEAA